ncbi:hypothetical protein Lbys_3161 [Leadbetterella byssophila DSM 17132]|uniref:DUF6089 domain-containing protein n=1 Tax=Leadbetterella byssophila (strain DSM 17132 / JCM 16389 / KACC 11308 / NBRC 106382 / 4M15) TaxID=649349 RepID=E4RV84_LEAB4|nr:DUF6089 family protein [Leadbetterella byssophila]ADQ18822.1 hypothetical protein Lbys_3161 [Leadbetterella byssophila DSM 17132]
MSSFRSIILLFTVSPLFCFAQKVEYGAGLGPTFYKGDLHPRFNVINPGAAGDIMLRYNFNRIVSARANFMMGLVVGDDSKSTDPFQKERDFKFRNVVMDYLVQLEYNFLNFRTHDGRYEHDWTPYLFGGVGQAQILQKKLNFQGAPIDKAGSGSDNILVYGIGFKKVLSSRWNLSGEFSTRTFLNKKNGAMFDGVDGSTLNNSYSPPRQFFFGNTQQNDKYFHASFTLSYLIYRVNCNTPGKKFSFF